MANFGRNSDHILQYGYQHVEAHQALSIDIEIRDCSEGVHSCSVFSKCSVPFCEIATCTAILLLSWKVLIIV